MASKQPLKFEGMYSKVTLLALVTFGFLSLGTGLLAAIVWAIGSTDSPHMAAFVLGLCGTGLVFLLIAYFSYRRWVAPREDSAAPTAR